MQTVRNPMPVAYSERLRTLLADIRRFQESEDGTDKHPDSTYLLMEVEATLGAILEA